MIDRVSLLKLLPQHGLSKLAYYAARSTWKPWKNALIRWAIRHYQIDMSEVPLAAEQYESFNAFFTRALKAEARPIAEATVVSPVDAQISQIGQLEGNRLLQAKGKHYSLQALLADQTWAERFENGHYATLYLSPKDYHRIHMPLDAQLKQMIFVPGDLFSVNQQTTEKLDHLFARNERLICLFETQLGLMALIMVGAIFVGSMETVWAGEVRSSKIQSWHDQQITLRQGQEMGRFNMGSTVILLFEPGRIAWQKQLGERVRMGEALAKKISH